MISDVMHDAVVEVDRYLNEMPDVYEGKVLNQILEVREAMLVLRNTLDCAPSVAKE